MSVSQKVFRDVMGRFGTGVTIVTTKHDREYYGLTVSSFTSVSLVPPLILVCIGKEARTLDHILGARTFAVNLLSDAQQQLCVRFARPSEKHRFKGLVLREGRTGAPIICGAMAFCEARVAGVYEGGDHVIITGELIDAGVLEVNAMPLIHFRSTYHTLR